MKSHIDRAYRNFQAGCDRADGLRTIFNYLKNQAPAALNCDDILRSSLVLAVSSFDLYIHDVFRTEVSHRFNTNQAVMSYRIPFEVILMEKQMAAEFIEASIRRDNSYKSFVAPDKLAECLRFLICEPWEKIAFAFGSTSSASKTRLKGVVDLRNRIAHEADVNPAYGGVELWPIYNEDVEGAIDFLRRLGEAIGKAVSDA